MIELLEKACSLVWGWPMIVLMLGTHVFLTFRLKVPQRRIGKGIRLSVTKDKGSDGDVSQFGALATSLAACIGTGNIIGVATAIALGGPGALLWCLLAGLFGIATKYAEGVLAVKYRVKNDAGEMQGGPMYALERGLGMKWLAVLFCVFTSLAAFGIGNMVQSNAISESIVGIAGSRVDPMTCKVTVGLVLAALTAVVVFGGVKGITRYCSVLVPPMAALYIVGCVVILVINRDCLWPAVCTICRDAFSLKSGTGGVAGIAIMTTMRFGVARGLFSNESGLGSAPIVAAAARSRNPVRQALVLSTGAFWDTVVICTLTGLVVVTSLLAHPDIDPSSPMLTYAAFEKIPVVGTPLLTFGIITFAFTTILGWSYYGERAIEYLFGRRAVRPYRIVWVVMVALGSVLSLSVVWNFADLMNAMMALPNLVALLCLSGVVARETKHYLWEGRLEEEMKNEE